MRQWVRALCVLFSLVLFSGCVETTKKVVAPEFEYSGFLSSYDQLDEVFETEQFAVKRWASESFKRGDYGFYDFVSTQYYPDARPTAQISDDTLTAILIYLDQSLRQGTFEVSHAKEGSKLMKIRAAITAVGKVNHQFESYDLVPHALDSMGRRDQAKSAAIAFEMEAVDPQTGEVLVQMVVTGITPMVKDSSSEQYTAAMFKPTIDAWIEFATSYSRNSSKPKDLPENP
jgi:hypothetical protein